ncbi:hypothetical protein BpHYR1_054287 [Brachionus plicatilis]|uniref:Uncharacterized protein n=1 Tax=Brachionus plicatilis TaxID=10195 RepID=A0A3M7S4P2_BRAPC|nr:hypothetical protein BpHYR1_054287 [Brachionus plicatilis]
MIKDIRIFLLIFKAKMQNLVLDQPVNEIDVFILQRLKMSNKKAQKEFFPYFLIFVLSLNI